MIVLGLFPNVSFEKSLRTFAFTILTSVVMTISSLISLATGYVYIFNLHIYIYYIYELFLTPESSNAQSGLIYIHCICETFLTQESGMHNVSCTTDYDGLR